MKTFIDENRQSYGVEPICKVLPIAPSTYYRYAAQQADPSQQSARAQRDQRADLQGVANRPVDVLPVRCSAG
ncbi:hypothetical protein AO272_06765 [Pseudomonas syringae pv. cerasicola]|nr:hypothetical protein AO272_06765 [Pseudomonas syringae pv. cerasicola]